MKSLTVVVLFLAVLFLAPPLIKADPLIFAAHLNGASESPPVPSPGSGFTLVTYDPTAHTLQVFAVFQGLTIGSTVAHIHATTMVPFAGTAGVATQTPTFPGFPAGVTSGIYDSAVFDLTLASSWNPAFITANGGTPAGAEAAFSAALANGRAYLNIHTSNFPGGEIRGFLVPTPEPTTMLLLGSGLAGVALKFRRRRKN